MTAKPVTAASPGPLAPGQRAADSHTGPERYLAEFRQLFDSMNPAPFRERDPKATACIVEGVRQAPPGRVLHIFTCGCWPIPAGAQVCDRPGVMDVRAPGTGATVAA